MLIFYQSPVARSWIRQRPQEFAEGLVKHGHQVFWFYAGSFHKTHFRRFDDGNGFFGMELPVLPFASRCRIIEWLNHLWVSWWLRRISVDSTIVTNPVAVPWLPKRLVCKNVLYDCMDVQVAFFTGCRRRRMQEEEGKLVASVARIVASSSVISDKLISEYKLDRNHIWVVPNGVPALLKTNAVAPVVVKHLSIAYFGTIASWFDWDSVIIAAEEHPEWNFDFFGPRDGAVKSLPVNIHLHEPIPHEQVYAQMRECDVLVMPFVRNEVIEGVDPVKMYEYLAAGRPIVSSWWPLLEKFRPFPAVSFYSQPRDFTERICAAIEQKKNYSVPIEFLEANSWNHRIAEFEQILKGVAAQ